MNPQQTLRAGFYARVSSDHQARDHTIASQVGALLERVERDGVRCPEELRFVDDGYSGSTLIRPSLERLRDLAANGQIDRLYVTAPDRLSRKYAYQVLLVDELQRSGVELVFLNHAFGESPEDELLLQVQGVVAEYERAKIMERCRRGKLHAAQRGQVSVMSSAPYGYRYVPRAVGGGHADYTIHLEEARVVRQMFEWVARERISLHEVRRRLQDRGVSSPRGHARWPRETIWHLLKNPTYKGRAAFGKTACGERRPRLRPLRNQPEQPRRPYSMYRVSPEKWIGITVPAIVSEDLFEAVQEQLAENRRRYRNPSRRRTNYLLRGLIMCGSCGYAMCGITVSRPTAERRLSYYRCMGRHHHRFDDTGRCENRPVNAVRIEEAVWADVCQLLAEPERIEAEYRRRLERKDPGAQAREQARLKGRIKELDRNIARLIDAYAEGLLDKSEFEPRISRIRQQQERVANEIQSQVDEESLQQEVRLISGHLKDFARQVKAGLGQADWETRQKIVAALVRRVEVEGERVRVVYRVDTSPIPSNGQKTGLQHCSRRSDPRDFAEILRGTAVDNPPDAPAAPHHRIISANTPQPRYSRV